MFGLVKRSVGFILIIALVSLQLACGETVPTRREAKTKSESTGSQSQLESGQGHSSSSEQSEDKTEQSSRSLSTSVNHVLYQCNAWPITNPSVWTYWIHWDAVFAAKTAVNACWSRTRLPCNYNCFRVQ